MESLSIPGVGGILENIINGVEFILIQDRFKDDAPMERGLIEIPAGKIRGFENIFDCLRREVKEETGLDIVEIVGEAESYKYKLNSYEVLAYSPFYCAQNVDGYYPIMVQIFICKVTGQMLKSTNETKNIRWISLTDLAVLLKNKEDRFYPMHVYTLKKYLKMKGID